jgi:hypothetical protein
MSKLMWRKDGLCIFIQRHKGVFIWWIAYRPTQILDWGEASTKRAAEQSAAQAILVWLENH